MSDDIFNGDNPIPEPAPIDPQPQPEPEIPPPEEQPEPEQPSTPADKVTAQVIDALSIGAINTISSSASTALADLYQHQINHIRRIDSMTEACLGKMLLDMSSEDPVETLAISKLFKGESDSSINSLLAQLSAGQIGGKIGQSTQGDLASEISKVGAAIASLQGLVGGLVGIIQQMLMDGTLGVSLSRIENRIPIPNTPSIPDIPNFPDLPDEEPSPQKIKYPTVTIRY